MPVTPYHFGPGLLLKSIAPTRFSFAAYAAAQVAIDIESGYYLFTNQPPFHRTFHTFLVGGALGTVVGVGAGALMRRFARRETEPLSDMLRAEWDPRSALVGGLVGGVLHSALDGVMHSDIHPFRPFTGANPLFHVIGVGFLHILCLVTGVIGAIALAVRHEPATAA